MGIITSIKNALRAPSSAPTVDDSNPTTTAATAAQLTRRCGHHWCAVPPPRGVNARRNAKRMRCCLCAYGRSNVAARPRFCGPCRAVVEDDDRPPERLVRHRNSAQVDLLLNFFVRTFLPFEVAHQVLSYVLASPPVPFFKFLADAKPRHIACGHTWCDLQFTGRCCACIDARPDKTIAVEYVDGVGNVVLEGRLPHERYCPSCKAKHSDDRVFGTTRAA